MHITSIYYNEMVDQRLSKLKTKENETNRIRLVH